MPLAQIPASAIAATIFRANVPTAIGSTLVTNPVTFAPIYVIAYKVGVVLLGKTPNKDSLEKVSQGITPTDQTNTLKAKNKYKPFQQLSERKQTPGSWVSDLCSSRGIRYLCCYLMVLVGLDKNQEKTQNE